MIRLLYLRWHVRQLRRAIDNARSAAGEQPRRPVWKRAGKRANGGVL